MKKMNNKGFMMAEVVVVSAVILVTLVALFNSYNKIFSLYNQRVNYYDVTTLYELAYIRDNNLYINNGFEPYRVDYDFNGDTSEVNRFIYFVRKYDLDDLLNYIKNNLDDYDIKPTYLEYLEYLNDTVDINKRIRLSDGTEYSWDNILIMEKCVSEDDCTYAYLEIPKLDV